MYNPMKSIMLASALYIPHNTDTDQPEELEKVNICVEFVLNNL